MSLHVSSSGGGDFETVKPGAYTARCYRIVDLGTQTQTGQFGTSSKPKIMISWELLDDDAKMEDGRPFSVHKTYTASLNEKSALYNDLVSWRGKEFTPTELESFDLKNILGAYCQIQVVRSDDGKYANVKTIMSTRNKPKGVNELVSFDIDAPDMKVFESFSDATKARIMQAPEWNKTNQSTVTDNDDSQFLKGEPDVVVEDFNQGDPVNLDDIPF